MNLVNKYPLNDPKYKFKLNKLEIIIGTIAINLLSLALPIMVLQVYDRIMVNYSYNTLMILGFIVITAVFLEAFMRILRSYATGWAGILYEYSVDANAVRSYIHADPDRLRLEGVGKRVQTLSSFAKLKNFHSGNSLVLMVDIPFAFVFLFLIFYIAGLLVFVPLALMVIFSLINWKLGNQLIMALQAQEDDDDNKYNFIIEALRGVHSIKSYGLEFLFKRKFELLEEKTTISTYNASLVAAKGRMYGNVFSELMVIAIVACGAPLVIASDMTTGGLVATTLLSGRLMQPVQKSLLLWEQYQEYKIADKKASELFSIPQISRTPESQERKKNGELEVKSLTLQKGRSLILQDINLKLEEKEVVAIHAVSSSVKDVLIKLLIGVKSPTKGSVLIDGLNANIITSEDLVHHIGLIEPDGAIFQGTVIDNLTGFDLKKEETAKALANSLGLHKYITSLPQGYDTKINDGLTDVISPGVKQKMSIIRVLLHKPKIILFNNADKGLDSEGYKYLLELITNFVGKVSIILITEDDNFCALAKKHYVLEDKKLVTVKYKKTKNKTLNITKSFDNA